MPTRSLDRRGAVPSPVVGSWHLVWLELPGSDGALLADTRSDEHWSVTWERD